MIQTWALKTHSASSNSVRVPVGARAHAAGRRFGDKVRAGRTGWVKAFRAMFFLLAFAILFSGFVLVRSFASSDGVAPAAPAESVIYVDTGDTLWSLAEAVKKPEMDTRRAVRLLADRNQLSASSLRAGQSLIVPAEMLP